MKYYFRLLALLMGSIMLLNACDTEKPNTDSITNDSYTFDESISDSSTLDNSDLTSSEDEIKEKNPYVDYEDDTIHYGNDATNEANYNIGDFKTLATGYGYIGEKEIKYVINPQSKITAFSSTTTVYDMSSEKFLASNEYKQGYKAILYTPDFYFSTTTANSDYYEYVLEKVEDKYIIVDGYESGYNTIPLNGAILAVLKQEEIAFSLNDEIKFTNDFNTYSYGIVNQDNVRLTFEKVNSYRADKDVVLYDRRFGDHNKTNQYGAEICVQFDYDKNAFVVEGFRGQYVSSGDLRNDHTNYGSYIPKYGFVLSAHLNAPNYDYYRQDRKFQIGDTLTFENYSFNEQLVEQKTFDLHYVANPSIRPDNTITLYNHKGNRLDQYGYTNNNLYGALELAVTEAAGSYGIITSIDREVSCPKDGYILSCNGQVAEELRKCVEVGTLVAIINNKLIISNKPGEKQLQNVNYYFNVLNSRNSIGNDNLYDYDYTTLNQCISELLNIIVKMQKIINIIENEMSDANVIFGYKLLLNQYYYDAYKIYEKGYCASTESNYIESRAAWYSNFACHSLEDLKTNLLHYKNANINLLYVQIFDGTTGFNSSMVPYDPDFTGDFGEYGKNNFLKAFVAEAHKLGIEVHGWTTNFYVGNYGSNNELFDSHPSWQQKYYDGNVNSYDEMTEQYLLYLDQANPEVHQFLTDFYNEALATLDLDGLHLDYIRYAAGNDVGHKDSVYCSIGAGQKLYAKNCLNRTTGYTDYAMNDFLREYGYDTSLNMKELIKDVEVYNKWTEYRANKVTDFVEKIYNDVTKEKNIPLSIAIVPEIEFAYKNKMQDWPKWIKNGWIDYLNGMYYSDEPYRIEVTTQEVKQTLIDNDIKVYQYPGVLACVYYELPNIYNVYYYEAAKNTYNMGGAFFEAQSIYSYHRCLYSDANTDVETLLKMGNHRNEAVLPHASLDKVMNAFIADITSKCDNLYIPNNCMSKNQKDELIALLNTFNNEDPEILLNQLTSLKENLSDYASGAAKDRISDYIDIIIEICSLRIE